MDANGKIELKCDGAALGRLLTLTEPDLFGTISQPTSPAVRAAADRAVAQLTDMKSAMVLTQDEWDDLATVATHYLSATSWAEKDHDPGVEHVRRRRALCERIEDARL